MEKYPDSPQAVDALIVKADAEARMGRTADAMATYQALEKRASNPSDVSTALMGILRLSRDLGDNDTAIATADRLLESSTLGEAGKREVSLLKAMALNDSGSHTEAIALWSTLADDIDDINGTKAQYYIAQTYSETGDDAKATEAVNRLDRRAIRPTTTGWHADSYCSATSCARRATPSRPTNICAHSAKTTPAMKPTFSAWSTNVLRNKNSNDKTQI